MAGIPHFNDSNLLVGSANADDAGVYQIDEERALVQTLDFFTPIVDDPYLYGQIAAANSLSDVYAMGGRPITAMAIAGMPDDKLTQSEISDIFRGGADLCLQASCSLVGGHTIKNPEPIYGLSVTGIVHPKKFLSNDGAKAGDQLILTKPLGTGIISSAAKQGAVSQASLDAATEVMITLNSVGALIGESGLANSCTDITGFGLLGHLREICEASELGATLLSEKIPAISEEVHKLIEKDIIPSGSRMNYQNVSYLLRTASDVRPSTPMLLADAQTSGGLLITCPLSNFQAVMDLLSQHNHYKAHAIGTLSDTKGIEIK